MKAGVLLRSTGVGHGGSGSVIPIPAKVTIASAAGARAMAPGNRRAAMDGVRRPDRQLDGGWWLGLAAPGAGSGRISGRRRPPSPRRRRRCPRVPSNKSACSSRTSIRFRVSVCTVLGGESRSRHLPSQAVIAQLRSSRHPNH